MSNFQLQTSQTFEFNTSTMLVKLMPGFSRIILNASNFIKLKEI